MEIAKRTLQVRYAYMRGELSSETYWELFDPQIEVRWHDQPYPDAPQRIRGASALVPFVEQYRSR